MMKSVALTDIRDDEFVLVEVPTESSLSLLPPPSSLSPAVDNLIALTESIVIAGDDEDDDEYDYCDEFVVGPSVVLADHYHVPTTTAASSSSFLTEPPVPDDDEPPHLTETDVQDAVDVLDDVPSLEVLTHHHTGSSSRTNLPSCSETLSVLTQGEPDHQETTAATTTNNKQPSLSRLSKKKRRKQLKQAKKAAAVAAATTALAAATSNPTTSAAKLKAVFRQQQKLKRSKVAPTTNFAASCAKQTLEAYKHQVAAAGLVKS